MVRNRKDETGTHQMLAATSIYQTQAITCNKILIPLPWVVPKGKIVKKILLTCFQYQPTSQYYWNETHRSQRQNSEKLTGFQTKQISVLLGSPCSISNRIGSWPDTRRTTTHQNIQICQTASTLSQFFSKQKKLKRTLDIIPSSEWNLSSLFPFAFLKWKQCYNTYEPRKRIA